MMLQHFKFPELFLKRSKNAYISFITPQLLALVQETKPRIQYSAIDTKLGREGFNTQTKQLRKPFATKLRTTLPQELIDLLQGRVSQTIFMKFYYRPLLEDTKTKVIKAIEPTQKELIEILQQTTQQPILWTQELRWKTSRGSLKSTKERVWPTELIVQSCLLFSEEDGLLI